MIVINNLNYVLLRLGVLLLILIGIFIFVTLSIVIFAKKFNCEEKVFKMCIRDRCNSGIFKIL